MIFSTPIATDTVGSWMVRPLIVCGVGMVTTTGLTPPPFFTNTNSLPVFLNLFPSVNVAATSAGITPAIVGD